MIKAMNDLPPSHELIRLYHADHPTCKVWRFGQWFINRYARNVTMPELFYEIDTDKAYQMVLDNFYPAT